jgi:4,5-DOPA dioxygenase extradiol
MIPTFTAVPPAPTFAGIPPIFVSHGSPMLMLAPDNTGAAWARIAAELPRPRAILAVSAHWTTRGPAVSATLQPETIHDFYGFPDALYDIEYRPPGTAELARDIARLIPDIAIDDRRGLDHGAWVPLRSMYPAADIPVVQFAVMPGRSPEEHYRLGQALRPLTEQGVLILASGSVTHNLRDLVPDAPDGVAHPYVIEFRNWLADRLEHNDLGALLDYRNQAPHALRAHPTDDHFLPLFVALGAAGERPSTVTAYRDYSNGALAMDAFVFTGSCAS